MSDPVDFTTCAPNCPATKFKCISPYLEKNVPVLRNFKKGPPFLCIDASEFERLASTNQTRKRHCRQKEKSGQTYG